MDSSAAQSTLRNTSDMDSGHWAGMSFAPEQVITNVILRVINEQIDEFPDTGIKVEGFKPDPEHADAHERLITLRRGPEALNYEIVASGDAQDYWEVEVTITRDSHGERHPVPEAILELSTNSVPTYLTATITEAARTFVAGAVAAS